jgi:hypothetical protein
MALLFLVFLSGVAGAAIQQFVPGMLTSMVPLETIYEQIPHVREQLLAEAGAAAAPESQEMIEMEADDREYVGRPPPDDSPLSPEFGRARVATEGCRPRRQFL